MSKPIDQVTREELYEEVWTDPMTTVSTRYGLSDVGLAKICRNLLIPLPSRGYWAKIKAGCVMKKIALPKLKVDRKVIAPITRLSDEMIAVKEVAKVQAKARVKEIKAQEVPVATELIDPHPFVRQASKRLKARDCPEDEKALRSDPGEVLNLVVTKGAIDRSLLLADLLIKALESQGASINIDKEKKATNISIKDTVVSFTITEHVARSRHEETKAEKRARDRYYSRAFWDRAGDYPHIPYYDYTPSGMLTLSIGHWPGRNWRDTKRTQLESRLPVIVAGVFELIEEIRQRDEEQRRKEELKQRAREKYQFTVNRYNHERDELKRFEENADNLDRAKRLRAYADQVEQQARETPDGITQKVKEWLDWARAKADWIDPLIAVSDRVLDAPKPRNPDRYYW